MSKINFDESIKQLNLNTDIITHLENNNIYTINDLWIMTRMKLKNIGLSDVYINQIIIKLELLGIDLGKKINSHDRV